MRVAALVTSHVCVPKSLPTKSKRLAFEAWVGEDVPPDFPRVGAKKITVYKTFLQQLACPVGLTNLLNGVVKVLKSIYSFSRTYQVLHYEYPPPERLVHAQTQTHSQPAVGWGERVRGFLLC